jgi:YHS domain-containing protein
MVIAESPACILTQFESLRRRVDDCIRWPSMRGSVHTHAARLEKFVATHRAALAKSREGRAVLTAVVPYMTVLPERLASTDAERAQLDVLARAKHFDTMVAAYKNAGSAAEADKQFVRLHALVPELDALAASLPEDDPRVNEAHSLIQRATHLSDKAMPSAKRMPAYDPSVTPRGGGGGGFGERTVGGRHLDTDVLRVTVTSAASPREAADCTPLLAGVVSSPRRGAANGRSRGRYSAAAPGSPAHSSPNRPRPPPPTSSSGAPVAAKTSSTAAPGSPSDANDSDGVDSTSRRFPHDKVGRPMIKGLEQRRPSTIIAPGLLRRRDSLAILMDNRPSIDVLKDRNVIREQAMKQKLVGVKLGLARKLESRPDAKELEERGILVAAKEMMKRRTQRRDSLAMLLDMRPSLADLQKRNIFRDKVSGARGERRRSFTRPSALANSARTRHRSDTTPGSDPEDDDDDDDDDADGDDDGGDNDGDGNGNKDGDDGASDSGPDEKSSMGGSGRSGGGGGGGGEDFAGSVSSESKRTSRPPSAASRDGDGGGGGGGGLRKSGSMTRISIADPAEFTGSGGSLGSNSGGGAGSGSGGGLGSGLGARKKGGGIKKSPSSTLLAALGQKAINTKISETNGDEVVVEVSPGVAQQLDPSYVNVDTAYPMRKSTSNMSISSEKAWKAQHPANVIHAVELGGYSALTYLEINQAVQGTPKFSAIVDGRTYHFRNQAEVMAFQDDPATYVPFALGRACAFTLAHSGEVIWPDPQTFKVIKGRTFLFANDGDFDGLARWEAEIEGRASTEEELVLRASRGWDELEHKIVTEHKPVSDSDSDSAPDDLLVKAGAAAAAAAAATAAPVAPAAGVTAAAVDGDSDANVSIDTMGGEDDAAAPAATVASDVDDNIAAALSADAESPGADADDNDPSDAAHAEDAEANNEIASANHDEDAEANNNENVSANNNEDVSANNNGDDVAEDANIAAENDAHSAVESEDDAAQAEADSNADAGDDANPADAAAANDTAGDVDAASEASASH